MTARRIGVVMGLLLLAAPANVSPAQERAAGAPRGKGTPNALPGVGDILDAVEKASAPQPGTKDWSAPVKLAVVFAFLAILPSLLVMMTSFTRIVIVLAFIRRALTTQNIPPTIAIVGLALFLTLFTMSPTFARIDEQALKPYLADQITFAEACSRGNQLLKDFMLRQTRAEDLELFVGMARIEAPQSAADLPAHVVIPSFAISEFRIAFQMGCLLFIPFLIIDLVVAGILLSAGMMMLPPAIISLPFKVILFVLVDGWRLMAKTLVSSFQ